jgi:ABC-type branched-subunit amino acid transport system ATPase component/ABC-type branched-subunit amino acid transport system permease subunit
MSTLFQFVLLGMATGAVYAMTAQGLVLVYRSSGVVNFAQGAFGAVGAFLYYEGRADGHPIIAVWIVALAVPAAIGAAVQLGVLSRLRHASALVRLVATLGVLFLIVAVANRIWAPEPRFVISPLPNTPRRPFGMSFALGEDRLWLIVIAFLITAGLSFAYRCSRFGQVTEAVAENPIAASGLGFSPNLIAGANWAIAGALAALAGIFIAPILLLQTTVLAFVVLRALAAALVGRFTSFWWTFVGALTIGVVESVLARYVAHEGVAKPITSDDGHLFGQFSAQAVSRSAAFLIIVVVLVVGGRALPLRNEIFDRLPAIGTGRINPPLLLAAVVSVGTVIMLVPQSWGTPLIVTLATGVILLSIVVVTGYLGQLSLAQLALAGFGAWVAGRLVDAAGWSFALALVAGIVLTVPVGVLVAIPALRTRGINLAVLTFGLSVVIFELVLANPRLTGGFEGTVVGRTKLFGINIDAFEHPERYGLLVLGVYVAFALMLANIRRGRAGRHLIAVRGNERAAASLGVNVYGAKVFAFGLGAAIAAAGGVLLAFHQQTIAYPRFGSAQSVELVVYSVIGGIGFLVGPVVGGTLAAGGVGLRINDALGFEGSSLEILSGVILLVTLLANPDGIAGATTHRLRRLLRRRSRGRSRARMPRSDARVELGSPVRADPHSLVVENLSVRYGGVVAVDDVSLRVAPGTIVGLIGPNGAGKTSFIDAVTGFTPSSGRVLLGDVPIDEWSPMRRARAGLARSFQSLELFEDLTVEENILVGCEQRSSWLYLRDLLRPGRTALPHSALAAVRQFDLYDDLHRAPGELSYGRRRLVAIARALASHPSVLLLDEPAAGLSEHETEELGVLIRSLALEWGVAILMVEHDMSLVMDVSDNVVVLDFGHKLAEGTPAEVTSDRQVISAYLGESGADDIRVVIS